MTRYELLDRIGVGGMAEIFRGKAVAAGGFEKPVAIKRILPHLSQDRRFVELLIAEAKVLSLLKHRNIVQIFDVGLGDDGQYFLVMEFVDGKDIGSVQRALEIQRRRMPFDLVLHIGAEVCEALEHAVTSRGPDGKPMALVHRDVSPSNVLLSRAGEVKLTDFGIAKRAEQDATHGGAVRGKFAYISPEQARNEHLDPRSDVFSVGILIWELLCGRRLFSQLGDLEALRAVRDPRIQRPTEIDPRLPPAIDDIVMMALARDKMRRFPSAGALGAKLRSLRYTLDSTVGDPATELAKLIDSTEKAERESGPAVRPSVPPRNEFDASEATVIRIHTADAFSARDVQSSVAARQVIDRFEDEETRLAQLSGDQMRQLRAAAPRDSSESPAATQPRMRSAPRDSSESPAATRPRTRAPSDEATRAIAPMLIDSSFGEDDDPPTRLPITPVGGNDHGFGPNEDTRLYQPRDRRTPPPQVTRPPPTAPVTTPRRPPSAPPVRRAPSAPQATVPHRAKPPDPAPPVVQPPARPPQPPRPQQPSAPVLPNNALPAWGPPIAAQNPPRDATPTAKDSLDRPLYTQPRPAQQPQVSGFQQRPARFAFKPWMLVVGAILVAILAFVITRAAIG